MWSVVPSGSVRHDSEELATSFVKYPTASDGGAEARTAREASPLSARMIWGQLVAWCRDDGVTQLRWSVVRGGEPTAFAELIGELGGVFTESTDVLVASIDAALALPAAPTAMQAEVIQTRDQLMAAEAVSHRVWGSGADHRGIESLATPIGKLASFGVLARDPSGAVVSVGECTLTSEVARLWGACTLEDHRGRGAYTAVLRLRLATARTSGATLALARARATTSAPIMARNGFNRYATYDKYTILLGASAPVDALAGRAKQLWEYLAGGGNFSHAIRVAVSPKSRLCPPSWVGIVVIGDDTLVTAPDNKTARVVGQVLSGLSADSVTSAGPLGRRLAAAEFLGPAALAYLDPANFRPWPGDVTITPLERDDPGLRLFLMAADTDELEESGIQEITTQAFAVRNRGQILAAAGYRDWPCGTAHLGVLTAAAARGHRLARAAASAAVIHALQEGRLPLWRARSEASLRVARALGFRELGSQVSVRLAPDITPLATMHPAG